MTGMDPAFLWKGIAIGFSIAAPVGPIGILCIRRSLAEGFFYGFLCGLGAASADALYGLVAGLGLISAGSLLISYQTWLKVFGGLFLCYLGYKAFRSDPPAAGAKAKSMGLLGAYGSTFLLTLVNPMTILSFSAVFAGMGIGAQGAGYHSAALLVAGVFTGSGLWWLTLSGFVSLFSTKVNAGLLKLVNMISGAALFVFGIVMIFM